jgi:hypothetical protein
MSLPKTMPSSPEDARLIALGRKVEALLASEEMADELAHFLYEDAAAPIFSVLARKALAWFREQLLGGSHGR